MDGPLKNLLVIDLTRVLVGPYCTMVLSDLGARVIKIEAPNDKSAMGGPRTGPDFQNLHRNKRSMALNLKSEEGTKIFKKFLNVKYVWGGKTFRGIDCSALLQIFYCYNNSFYPRDTKDQIKYSKKNLKEKLFKKGDIIFWKGHVAMCLNSKQLIHAYGPERKVIIMPIIETINRIQKTAKLKVKKVSRIKY